MIISLMYLIARGVLVEPLTKRFGEVRVIKLALIGNAIGFVGILMASSYMTMIVAISFFILLNALLKPSALSFVSKHTEISQGMAMGLTESYMSLGRIFGPLVAGLLFDINIFYPFLCGAIVFLVLFLISSMFREKESI